jgi:hypothetical protein
MPYASNNNAVLFDNCNVLQNPSVLLEVAEDLATANGGGWSFQLNCFPPRYQYCQAVEINWMQYIVIVQDGKLKYRIRYLSAGTDSWPPGTNPQPGTTPSQPCWDNDYTSVFATGIDGDTLPARSRLAIGLITNDGGGVSSVTFQYTDPNGNLQSNNPDNEFAPTTEFSVVALECNLVGPPGGAANFTQGIANSRGIIYYNVFSTGQLSVQNGGPGSACDEASVPPTPETSNMSYSDIEGAPASTVTQTLQQPVACVVNGFFKRPKLPIEFEEDREPLGEMRQLRDREIARHPAGQWLIEVLDRHSADLALSFAPDDGELAEAARDLLVKAVHTSRGGLQFNDTTINEALKVLEQVSCKLPPSMYGVGPAAETVLKSLRGRTLEDGLTEASKTILPHFKSRES